jgi:hypothetical protein
MRNEPDSPPQSCVGTVKFNRRGENAKNREKNNSRHSGENPAILRFPEAGDCS